MNIYKFFGGLFTVLFILWFGSTAFKIYLWYESGTYGDWVIALSEFGVLASVQINYSLCLF